MNRKPADGASDHHTRVLKERSLELEERDVGLLEFNWAQSLLKSHYLFTKNAEDSSRNSPSLGSA